MQHIKLATAALAAGVTALASHTAFGQQFGRDDFVIVATHIDNVQGPLTIADAGKQCSDDLACSIAARLVSNATGVPVDRMIAVAGAFATQHDGEGTFMHINLPAGYAYCSSSMRLTSIVPHDGDRGSTFLGRSDPDGFYVETWTPREGLFGARSWVEGDISVIGVRSEIASSAYQFGHCREPGRAIFYCRGGGCDGGADDNGQNVDTSSPPGAGSRK